jgi:hypothetical protein
MNVHCRKSRAIGSKKMGNKIFLLCHVPKTAGTSLIDALKNMFEADNCHIQTSPGDISFIDKFEEKVSNGARLFSGHAALPFFINVKNTYKDQDISIITSVRNPIDHFFSLFLHNKHFMNNNTWQDIGLRKILRNNGENNIPHEQTFNMMTRYFSGKLSGKLDSTAYKQAIINMKHLDFVFLSEELERSLHLFSVMYDVARYEPTSNILNSNSHRREKFQNNNVDLVPEISANTVFDYHLYSYMQKLRISGARKFPTLSLSARKVDFSYVAEAIRRSKHDIFAEKNYFSFENNDLLLHPPKIGKTFIKTYDINNSEVVEKATCTLSLSEKAHNSVVFEIVIENGKNLKSIVEILNPGENKNITIRLDDLQGNLNMILETKLKSQGGANSYCWAYFKDFKFIFS